jgi:hypothetical protein
LSSSSGFKHVFLFIVMVYLTTVSAWLECVTLFTQENFLSVKKSAVIPTVGKIQRRNVKKRHNLHLFLDYYLPTAPNITLLTCVYASLRNLTVFITDVHSPLSFVWFLSLFIFGSRKSSLHLPAITFRSFPLVFCLLFYFKNLYNHPCFIHSNHTTQSSFKPSRFL